MKYRSPLKTVKGLGAAKSGTGHFIHQRLTALFLIPLTLLFMSVLVCMLTAENYFEIKALFQSPFWATALILFIIVGFYHAALGLQVVIEDYIHHELLKVGLLALVRFVCLFCAVMAVFSIFNLAFA